MQMFYWSYNDPLFGEFSSSFSTQLRLAGVDPNFGDPSSIVIDSFVLGLGTADIMGNWTNKPLKYMSLTSLYQLTLPIIRLIRLVTMEST